MFITPNSRSYWTHKQNSNESKTEMWQQRHWTISGIDEYSRKWGCGKRFVDCRVASHEPGVLFLPPLECLFKNITKLTTQKPSRLWLLALCAGNPLLTSVVPEQRVNNVILRNIYLAHVTLVWPLQAPGPRTWPLWALSPGVLTFFQVFAIYHIKSQSISSGTHDLGTPKWLRPKWPYVANLQALNLIIIQNKLRIFSL